MPRTVPWYLSAPFRPRSVRSFIQRRPVTTALATTSQSQSLSVTVSFLRKETSLRPRLRIKAECLLGLAFLGVHGLRSRPAKPRKHCPRDATDGTGFAAKNSYRVQPVSVLSEFLSIWGKIHRDIRTGLIS